MSNLENTPCFIMQQLDISLFFILVLMLVVNCKVYSPSPPSPLLSHLQPSRAWPKSLTCFHAAGVAGSNRCFQDWILNYIFGKFLKLVEKYNKMCICILVLISYKTLYLSALSPCLSFLSLICQFWVQM